MSELNPMLCLRSTILDMLGRKWIDDVAANLILEAAQKDIDAELIKWDMTAVGEAIPVTHLRNYSVITEDALVNFEGEPDADGNLYTYHDGKVYRMTIKAKE